MSKNKLIADQARFDAFQRLTTDQRIGLVAGNLERHFNCDAGEAIVFARELLRVRTQLIEVEYPELKARRFMTQNTEVSPTDEEYTYQTAADYGTTDTGASYTNDAPRADVSFDEADAQRIRPITAAYGYSFHEELVSARLGRRLPMRKARAAKRAIDFEVERLLAFGDPGGAGSKYGTTIKGLLTLDKESTPTSAGVREYSAPAGAGGATWLHPTTGVQLKSSEEIVADLHGMVKAVVHGSNEIFVPNTILLPLEYFDFIAEKRMGDASDTTILNFFLQKNRRIKRVEPWYKLDAAPDSEWTGKRAVCYRNDQDVLDYLLPVEFRQRPPQIVRNETIVDADARCGGVVVYQEKAICYTDNF